MNDKAIKIVTRLRNKGFEALFAGGCVRDMLLGHMPKDFDIATSAKPDEVRALFPKTFAVGESFGVIIVVEGGEHFEVATFRKDSETSDGRRPDSVEFTSAFRDARRRDLTINGLFLDPLTGEVIDFVHGMDDIETKTVRFIGHPEERIKEDKLRMLRAIRFASKEGFSMTTETELAIRKHLLDIHVVSSERIREELEKMLLLPVPSKAFNLMFETGILWEILSELAILDQIPQNPKWHKEGNAFVHTMLAIDTARKLSDDPIVMWGALFHDLGKGEPIVDENGKLIFHGHDEKGMDIADEVLRRLKFSNEDRITITSIVADHMRVKHLPEMRKSKVRYLMSRDHFDRLLLVSDIDSRSSLHENHLDDLGKRTFVTFAENFENTLEGEEIMPKPFITGNDLIALGLKPGPKLGAILKVVSDLQLDGIITSREMALDAVEEHLEEVW